MPSLVWRKKQKLIDRVERRTNPPGPECRERSRKKKTIYGRGKSVVLTSSRSGIRQTTTREIVARRRRNVGRFFRYVRTFVSLDRQRVGIFPTARVGRHTRARTSHASSSTDVNQRLIPKINVTSYARNKRRPESCD